MQRYVVFAHTMIWDGLFWCIKNCECQKSQSLAYWQGIVAMLRALSLSIEAKDVMIAELKQKVAVLQASAVEVEPLFVDVDRKIEGAKTNLKELQVVNVTFAPKLCMVLNTFKFIACLFHRCHHATGIVVGKFALAT